MCSMWQAFFRISVLKGLKRIDLWCRPCLKIIAYSRLNILHGIWLDDGEAVAMVTGVTLSLWMRKRALIIYNIINLLYISDFGFILMWSN